MFWNGEVAFKYKMSAMQAALGLAQLERVEDLLRSKRLTFLAYNEGFKTFPGVRLNLEPVGTRNQFWMTTLVWDERYNVTKESVISQLASNGVDARPFFYPLSTLPAYEGRGPVAGFASKTIASGICARGINLPSPMNISADDIQRVVSTTKAVLVASL